MVGTLIIDDEIHCRRDLRRRLSAFRDIEILGEAATLAAARAMLAREDYSLVFLDVHLRGGLGFDLVPQVREGARVVFVTAHDAFALRAFEVNALDYLLKPVTDARLGDTLRRLVSEGRPETDTPAEGPVSRLRAEDIVHLSSGRRARFARVTEISAILAEDNYTEVMLTDGTRSLVRRSLRTWEDALPPELFMRVHRTQIVNLAQVERYERDKDERTAIFLGRHSTPLKASRHRWGELKRRLKALCPGF